MSRNVVLICLDTVRKDFFDEYAPRLQRLADVSFEECRAAASWTVPSHASMLTGRLAHQHDTHTHDRDFSALADGRTFLDDLPAHRTVGVSANVHAGPAFGFDELFDEFTAVAAHNRFLDGIDVKQFLQHSDETGVARYLAFLREAASHPHPLASVGNAVSFKLGSLLRDTPVPKLSDDGAKRIVRASQRHVADGTEPFFLFTNVMDAHPPFQHTRGYDRDLHDAPNDWTSLEFDYWEVREDHDVEENRENLDHFRSLYAASIDYLDRTLVGFVEWLLDATERETTAVVTADHGEELSYPEEDYRIGHLGSLGEGLLHVPCYVVNPPGPLETDGYFSHLDLGRLLCGFARGETPSVVGDRAVAETVGGMRHDFDAPISDERFAYWNRLLRCTYDGSRKVVWDSLGNSDAYDVSGAACTERWLEADVEPPDWSREYFQTDASDYKRHASTSDEDALDDATRDRLEKLGYL